MIGREKNHTKSHSFLDLDEMQESFDWSYLVLDYFSQYITEGTKGIVYCDPAQLFTSPLLLTLDNRPSDLELKARQCQLKLWEQWLWRICI